MSDHTDNITCIFSRYDGGLITENECLAMLGREKVRGGFDETGQFTGYDYQDQKWIADPT